MRIREECNTWYGGAERCPDDNPDFCEFSPFASESAEPLSIAEINAEILASEHTVNECEDLGVGTAPDGEGAREVNVFKGEIFADRETGEILAVGQAERMKLHPDLAEYALELDIVLLTQIEDLPEDHPDYRPMTYALSRPDDSETAYPQPRRTRFSDEAMDNLEATIRYCNDPSLINS